MCKLKGELEVQMVHEAVNNSINNTAGTSSPSNRNNACHSCYINNNSDSNDSDSNSMNSNESCNKESASRPKVHRRKRHESAHRTTYIRDKFRDSSHSNSAASIFRDFHRHSQHPVSVRNCNETNYHETSSSDSDSDGELSDVSNDEELKFQRAERSSSMLSFRKAVEDLLSDGKVDSSLLENYINFFHDRFKKFM